MKPQLLTLLLFFVTLISNAQVGVVPLKEYADLKKRTLLVIVEEPRQDVLDNMDATQAEIYKKEIAEYNTLVKEAMDAYYKVGNPVEYKSASEVMAIVDKKDKGYAYLSYSKLRDNYKSKLGFEMTQKNRVAKEQSKLAGVLSLDFILSYIEIRFAEQPPMAQPVYAQYMPTPFPDKADMVYAFRQITSVLNDREQGITYDVAAKQIKKEASKLQSQTLLVAENDVAPDEDRGKFISSYKYAVEIAPVSKVAEAIISGNPQYATVITVPIRDRETDKVEFKFFLYDCASGKAIATSVPQDKNGISTGSLTALRALKKAVTESKIPPLKKENMIDFRDALK